MTNQIFISDNPSMLEKIKPDVTVEAEYGDIVVNGNLMTLAHHGKNYRNNCPCLGGNLFFDQYITIGISHFDLDTLGALVRIFGLKDISQGPFWLAAAFIDINGLHSFSQDEWGYDISSKLYAFYAWNEINHLYATKNRVVECTDFFMKENGAFHIIDEILKGNPTLIKKGELWKERQFHLNEESLIEVINDKVVLRESNQFVNHLYNLPSGETVRGIVSYNPTRYSISISVSKIIDDFSVGEFVKSLWGPLAGGHKTIAGSPRNQKMTYIQAIVAAYKLAYNFL